MRDICYIGPICTIGSEIIAIAEVIIRAEFHDDILSNKKVSIQGLELN